MDLGSIFEPLIACDMALLVTLSNTTEENAISTLYALLKSIRARVTGATVRESLVLHPDFPSLLSLSDLLTDWKIENIALQLNTAEQLRELPLPCIAHLHKKGGWYVLVTALQGNRITYQDSADGNRTESLADFGEKWSGVVLLAEADEQSGERTYAEKRKQEKLAASRESFIVGGLVFIFLCTLAKVTGSFTVFDWILLLTKISGLILSTLLVAKQLGNQNKLTDRLCHLTSQTNCDDVLNSPAAKLWDWLSWTDVGLLYFAGGLLTVFTASVLSELRPLLYGIAIFTLPYTVFSIYYQGFVLRKWCPLCLGVQGILLLEGMLAIIQISPLPVLWQPYIFMLSVFLLPMLIWILVRPLLIYRIKNRLDHEELMRLRRDPDLFRALLMQQPQMPVISTDMCPIMVGNPEAEHTVTMVTNPYCRPCARTHNELERLIEQNHNLNASIIFVCDGTNGAATQVAVHMMSLVEQGRKLLALKEWYEQAEKNFDTWAQKYPIDSRRKDWVSITNEHNDWCLLANIEVTPTLFIDGYHLPKQYQLEDLRWLINYTPVQISIMDLAKSQ